jgi:flavin reductase (DIM6/NTAB) family NADH-FMN oxidoreductase RutF
VTVEAARQHVVAGESLRRVMRRHAAGVAVITTGTTEPRGFCATSLVAVCLDPPTVSFAVASASASGLAWARAEHGLVHLLRADQRRLARVFARSGPEKFGAGVDWCPGPRGQPLLDGVQAWLLVSPVTRVQVGDHLVVICEVEESSLPATTASLVYHDGDFYGLP